MPRSSHWCPCFDGCEAWFVTSPALCNRPMSSLSAVILKVGESGYNGDAIVPQVLFVSHSVCSFIVGHFICLADHLVPSFHHHHHHPLIFRFRWAFHLKVAPTAWMGKLSVISIFFGFIMTLPEYPSWMLDPRLHTSCCQLPPGWGPDWGLCSFSASKESCLPDSLHPSADAGVTSLMIKCWIVQCGQSECSDGWWQQTPVGIPKWAEPSPAASDTMLPGGGYCSISQVS